MDRSRKQLFGGETEVSNGAMDFVPLRFDDVKKENNDDDGNNAASRRFPSLASTLDCSLVEACRGDAATDPQVRCRCENDEETPTPDNSDEEKQRMGKRGA